MKLKINITKEVLEESKNCCFMDAPENCAVAVAIRDIFPGASVGANWFNPFLNNGNVDTMKIRIPMPDEAAEFIGYFDTCSPAKRVAMQPFSFEIDIPRAVIDRINIDELKPLLENHPTLELIND